MTTTNWSVSQQKFCHKKISDWSHDRRSQTFSCAELFFELRDTSKLYALFATLREARFRLTKKYERKLNQTLVFKYNQCL